MLNTDDSWLNPSKRAKDYLDKALEGDSESGDLVVLNQRVLEKEAQRKKEAEKKAQLTDFSVMDSVEKNSIKVDEARLEEPVLEQVIEREKVRLLIITKDATVLQKGSIAYQRMSGEREVFYEVHVIVLNVTKKEEEIPVFRPFENVWVYQTNSTAWWKVLFDARKISETQLVFSGGFRADIVIADNLFEAALFGLYIAEKYDRPFQLHIHEDFFDAAFIEEQKYPSLYEISVWYILRHVVSVRTSTEFQRQAVIKKHPDLEATTELLPNYYNLNVWRDLAPTFDLHERYPQFKFIILHVSSMRTSSHSMEALLGASKILKRYPTVGLVIVGNGPMRAGLERQVIALGIQNQVEFEPMPSEVISHMKTANIFIHLSEDSEEENLVLEAAVSRVPLIVGDGESACLCKVDDVLCVSESINRYLNQNQDRSSFALNASEIVFDRVEQDYGAYLGTYRDSIERCMDIES
jgi:glycosyltransferase involved in cell wall biosynthesis